MISNKINILNRTIYYGCKQLSKMIVKGDRYDLLKPSIVISFVKDKVLPEIEDMHSEYVICNRKYGTQLSDLLELHYIELGKIDWSHRDVSKLSPLEQLGAYFICSGNEEEKTFVEELVDNGMGVISMTDNILQKVSQDEKLRCLRESREMAQMEIDWGMQIAEKEGSRKTQHKIARELKMLKVDIETIVKSTGLTIKEIEAL